MKNDFITIFNQLTSSKLADYSLFSDLIDNHYEKFKYLYYLIGDVDISKIDTIYAKTSKKTLTTYITPKNVKYSNEIIFDINSKKHKYQYSNYFEVNLIEERNVLEISIKTVDNKKEGDIYADRLI